MFKPSQNFQSNKCTACGICSKVCPNDAVLTNSTGLVISFSSACIGCAHCGCYCPSNCFKLPKEEDREIAKPQELQNLFEIRRSIRLFSDKIIADSVIHSLLEPVGFSPTGKNSQGVTVDVIQGTEIIKKLIVNPITKIAKIINCCGIFSLLAGSAAEPVKKLCAGIDVVTWNAPCVLLFKAPLGNVTGKTDSIIAATMVSIKAESMGLGVFWNGVIQITSSILPLKRSHAVLCIGYPALKKYQHISERKWSKKIISLDR